MYHPIIKRAGHRNLLNKPVYGALGDAQIRVEPKHRICQSSLPPERTKGMVRPQIPVYPYKRTDGMVPLSQYSLYPDKRTNNGMVWPPIPISQYSLFPDKRPSIGETWTQQNTTNLIQSNKENHLPLIPTPEPGKYFDVVSCLSSSGGGVLIRNNGDTVCLSADRFKGKYVLVCCFHVPLVETDLFQALMDRCTELYSTRDDFELVMVAGTSNQPSRSVFDRFFLRFPESCLAVPFEHSKQRDSICKLLDLDSTPPDGFQRLLLDKEGIVVPPVNLLSVFLHHEVEEWQCELKRTDTITLESLLRSRKPSSPAGAVYKLNPGGGPREEVAISDLKFDDKTVGVYYCCNASLLDDLIKIYKECKEKKLDFKVVVVFMYNHSFQKNMEILLLRHDVCQEWWCSPYDEAVTKEYLELWDNELIDRVIVTGPLVKYGYATDAGFLMAKYGIDAYPFSGEAAIEAFVKKLRNLRMESLLGSYQLFRGNDRDDVTSVEGLRGKKIILHVDSLYCKHWKFVEKKLDALVPFYGEMKAAFSGGFEMVFIQTGSCSCPEAFDEDSEKIRKVQGAMPWYVCPHNRTTSDWADDLLMNLNKSDHGFFGFDEDGRLCAILDYTTIEEYREDLIREFQPSYDTIHACGEKGVCDFLCSGYDSD